MQRDRARDRVTVRPGAELSRAADRAGRYFLGFGWLALLPVLVLLRELEHGLAWCIVMLGIAWLGDTGAYFAGRAWGSKKLAPQISPNKSVEGALGGVIAGVLLGLGSKLLCDVIRPDWSAALPWSVALLFGLVLCVVGIIGDLVESLLKRDAEVKDTGALLPGMGGVLDRIDAPLLGLPAMYYMMLGYVFFRSL